MGLVQLAGVGRELEVIPGDPGGPGRGEASFALLSGQSSPRWEDTVRNTRDRFVVDVAGPGLVYVLCAVRNTPGYGRRVAGPFATEVAADVWIAINSEARWAFAEVAS